MANTIDFKALSAKLKAIVTGKPVEVPVAHVEPVVVPEVPEVQPEPEVVHVQPEVQAEPAVVEEPLVIHVEPEVVQPEPAQEYPLNQD
jgi:hypothetical protein